MASEGPASLPQLNVDRIARRALPREARVTSEARSALRACAEELVLFLASHTSDTLAEHSRKTVYAADVVQALVSLGLDDYVPFARRFCELWERTHEQQQQREGDGDGDGGVVTVASEGSQMEAEELLERFAAPGGGIEQLALGRSSQGQFLV
eukprot:m51a1_g5009 putative nuclear transcription factor y subunit b-3 (153) ;mRNA; r:256891-257349